MGGGWSESLVLISLFVVFGLHSIALCCVCFVLIPFFRLFKHLCGAESIHGRGFYTVFFLQSDDIWSRYRPVRVGGVDLVSLLWKQKGLNKAFVWGSEYRQTKRIKNPVELESLIMSVSVRSCPDLHKLTGFLIYHFFLQQAWTSNRPEWR